MWTSNRKLYLLAGVFGFITIIICVLPYALTRKSTSFNFGQNTGPIGDTIGGTMGPFIAIMAAALTFLAFWIQYKANEQQRKDIADERIDKQKESTELRFFELVKLHRENVRETTYSFYKKKKKDGKSHIIEYTAHHREVFKFILGQFEDLHNEVEHLFVNKTDKDIYEAGYLAELESNKEVMSKRPFSLEKYAKVDILYLIIFFGLGNKGRKTIEGFLENRYQKRFYEPILYWASLKPVRQSDYWKKWKWFDENKLLPGICERTVRDLKSGDLDLEIHSDKWDADYRDKYYLNLDYTRYYGGHQFRLGHYFRHLYQTLVYVNEQTSLSYKEKYSYAKILRGQLSTHEQIIYFLNSLSALGRITELEQLNNDSKAPDINQQLITKYNFIKNIPNDVIVGDIKVASFYPNIEYEAIPNGTILQRRSQLESQYK